MFTLTNCVVVCSAVLSLEDLMSSLSCAHMKSLLFSQRYEESPPETEGAGKEETTETEKKDQ